MEKFTNLEAEQIILGSLLCNNFLLRKIEFLEEKHFAYTENKMIFKEILSRIIDSGKVDEITIANFFKNNTAIGLKYLKTLLLQASAILDIRSYAQEIIELWQKREMEALLTNSLKDLNDKKFSFVSANIENELAGLILQNSKEKSQTSAEILEEMNNEIIIDDAISTGFTALDRLLMDGIRKQQLLILGARPSVGKTSWAQNIILNVCRNNKKCLFISLEVDKRNVMKKFLSIYSSVEFWKIIKKKLSQADEGNLNVAKKFLKESEIVINDSSFLKIGEIGIIIKNYIERHPIDLVVIDYIQIIRGEDIKNKNEATIIKDITSKLKGFAKQYNIAIIALAQINRKAAEGAKQEPTINDFKSSGGIEEDADIALILHRDRNDNKKDGYFSKYGKIIVAKNRHGETGEIPIIFNGQTGSFTETNF